LSILRLIGQWTLGFVMLYGVPVALGPEWWEALFGPYEDIVRMLLPYLPAWDHPLMLVVYGVVVLLAIPGWTNVARVVACAIIGLVLARGGFWLAGVAEVPPPGPVLIAIAVIAAGWLVFSASFGDPRWKRWWKRA